MSPTNTGNQRHGLDKTCDREQPVEFCGRKTASTRNVRQQPLPPENLTAGCAGHHVLKSTPFDAPIFVADETTRRDTPVQMRSKVRVSSTIPLKASRHGSIIIFRVLVTRGGSAGAQCRIGHQNPLRHRETRRLPGSRKVGN